MDLGNFFQLEPIPPNAMGGNYDESLVILSYLMAVLASYVALDITERIRTQEEESSSKNSWFVGGALVMGLGIWTMHFIGMLAFVMPMPIDYDTFLTAVSLVVALIASGFAFFLIKNPEFRLFPLIGGGILLGFGISAMHYIGMSAMMNVHITYIPSLFILSILIAIAASEAALWLMIQSCDRTRYHTVLKLISASVMGFGICGMHYMGMAAAVFVEKHEGQAAQLQGTLDPTNLSLFIAGTTLMIILIALTASRVWMNVLLARNIKLLEAEQILEQHSLKLHNANREIAAFAEECVTKEERIRAILTAAADGIIVTDGQGIVEECNRAAAEIFGYPAQAITSRRIDNFIGLPQKYPDQPFQAIHFDSLALLVEPIECTGLREDQTQIPIELNLSRSKISDKDLYVIILRDISERKRAQENLNILNNQIVAAARVAGMAEVATCVLHNVGNVLNSVNISAQLLLDRNSQSQVPALIGLAELLKKNRADVGTFLETDPVGKILPEYLQSFAEFWKNEQTFQTRELESLNAKIQHIKEIVAMQQSISGRSNIIEVSPINALLEDALAINSESIERYKILVEKRYEEMAPIRIDKVKTLQTLVNLIKNALESLVMSQTPIKRLIVQTTSLEGDLISIAVIDNGLGIKSEDLNKIFNYGFTTKKSGHGFGLHASALSAQEIGGSLKAFSPGPNQGATFILTLPKQIHEAKLEEVHL